MITFETADGKEYAVPADVIREFSGKGLGSGAIRFSVEGFDGAQIQVMRGNKYVIRYYSGPYGKTVDTVKVKRAELDSLI